MGAVSKAVDVVTDVVDDVVTAVDNTVQSALDDPVNTAIRIGATMVAGPAGLAAANTAISLGQGEDLGTSLEQGAKGYATAAIGAEVGAGVAGETGSTTAGNMASGATKSALSGGDPLTGAITSGINSSISEAAKAMSDQEFENWAKEQAAQDYDNAYSPTEQDVLAADPSIQMNFPLSTPTDATGPGYYDEISGAFVPDTNGGLQGPLTEASGTGTIDAPVADMTGLNPQPTEFTTPTDNTPAESFDPTGTKTIASGLKFAVNAAMNPSSLGSTGFNYSALSPLTAAPAAAFAAPQFLDTSAQYLGGKPATATTTEPSTARLQELKQLYEGLTPELASVMADRGVANPQATQDPSMTTTRFMADGGSTDLSKFADSLNPTSSNIGLTKTYSPNMLPAAPLMSNPMKLNPLRHLHESLISRQRTAGGLANGGLPQKYAEAMPAGHKPEFITGLTGYYATGKGTGQSDEIDAMLHDGDYVADADLVAALGDGSSKAGAEALEKFRRQIPHQEHAVGGSAVPAKIADGEYVFPASFVTAIGGGDNKAGAKILDKMREAIRAHKRSAPTTKIPPKAKSPLEYLKMVKG